MKRFTPYLFAMALAAAPAFAQNSPSPGAQDTTSPPAATRGASGTPTDTHGTNGPGSAYPSGSATPDTAASATSRNNPYDNTNSNTNNDSGNHNFGWIGLVGLAGLAGLFRGTRDNRVTPRTTTDPRV